MPSVNSSSVPVVVDSSTVITPSLPTLSNASAMQLADLGRPGRRWSATWAMSSVPSTARAASSSVGAHRGDGGLDAPLEVHRGGAGGDVAQALADHRLGQHGRGGGAVTGDVVGLGGDLLGELGAEVLVRVVELDLAGDGHAVVGDRGRAPLLVEDDVAALGAERHLDGVGEGVDAALERAARVLVELQDLGHGRGIPLGVSASMKGVSELTCGQGQDASAPGPGLPGRRGARVKRGMLLLDDGEHVAGGEDEVLLAVVLDLGAAVLAVDDVVADLDVERDALSPSSSKRPGPTARTLPSWGFSFAVSGMTRPEAVVCSASSGWTTMRSSSGLMETDTVVTSFEEIVCRRMGEHGRGPGRGPAVAGVRTGPVALALSRGECQRPR